MFDDVDVDSFKNSLMNCKNAIKYNNTKEILSSIENPDIWQCDSKNTLKNALNTLVDIRYKKLEETIDKCLNAASSIEECQNLKKENEQLKNKYNNLSKSLYRDEKYTTDKTNEDGTVEKEEHTRTVKNYNVEQQMNNTLQQVQSNESRIETLKGLVSDIL